jgi:branched-chain amino acid transport system permease protein
LRYASPQMPMIASIGVSMMLQGYVFTTGGARDLWVTAPLPGGFVLAQTDGFSLYVNWWQTVIIVATLLLTGLTWFVLTRTSFGRAHRACAQDRRMASLLGIDVDRVIGMTFGFAGMFAAAGGLMAATYYGSISVVMGVMMGLKALTAAVVGGIGSARGAVLGGFIVALSESLAAGYFFAAYKEVVVFAILILLLIFRPQGLLGES